MFDLEQSISVWRQQMLSAGIQSPVPLEELELHLREEIDRQTSSGASPENAFAAAGEKIGQLDQLKTEFSKVGEVKKSKSRERWMIGFIAVGMAIPLELYLLFKNELSPGWRLAGFANVAVIALTIFGWRRINRIFPVIPNRQIRLTTGLTLTVLGMAGMIVLMDFILWDLPFTEGQLAVVVFWGLTVMAAFGGVTSGLEEAAQKQNSTTN